MIRITNLTKTYRLKRHPSKVVHAVDGVTAEMRAGSIVGVLGPNGAGKSTLFKILVGLHIPSSGSAEVLGFSPATKEARSKIGYLQENFQLPRFFTPESTLTLTARLYSIPGERVRQTVNETLALIDLLDWKDVRVDKLSKGMRQRLGMGQALLPDCPVLLLDEPLDGLDVDGRRLFKQILLRIRDEGKTILLSTHHFADVEELCDELIVLHKGKILKQGATQALLRTDYYVVSISDVSGQRGEVIQLLQSSFVKDGDLYVAEVPSIKEADMLIAAAQDEGMRIVSVQSTRDSLEKYFIDLVRNS